MVQSCEVRWFFSDCPDAFRQWFERRGWVFSSAAPPRRCDFYLVSGTARADLGIKLREGNIEIKERVADLGVHRFGASAEGRVEAWRKWSFPLAHTREGGTEEALHITRQDDQGRGWIPVRKDRLLLMLEIVEESRVLLSEAPAFSIEEGCGVELTKIFLPDRTCYSFALEAFSNTDRGYQNLLRAMDTMTAEVPEPVLPLFQSMGYAEFLSQ